MISLDNVVYSRQSWARRVAYCEMLCSWFNRAKEIENFPPGTSLYWEDENWDDEFVLQGEPA